ncbi:ATP-binding protein [Sphingomonas sp. Leaf21]|uniref:ATP-binding protein n=1 Tax=Sphingomonas sp. Leaf21 TaxID=2876550 RepID=UPI001E5691A5|nr:ATP-binding protein [Sphingomonas sp. Leaf21]
MRALRIALIVAALLAAGLETRAHSATTPQPVFDRAIAAAKTEMLRDPAVAIQQAEAARRYARGFADADQRALALATADWLRGEGASRTGDNDTARLAITDALATARRLAPQSDLYGNVLLSKGSLDTEGGNIAAALDSYQAAYRVFQRLSDSRGQARALVQIANLYIDAKDFTSALRYLGQARTTYRGDDALRMVVLNNRSVTLDELGRTEDALVQLREVAALAQRMNSPALLSQVWRNIARSELRLGRVAAASASIERARRADSSDHRALTSIAAQAAFQRGDLTEAAGLIDQSFQGVDVDETATSQAEAHKRAYQIYAAVGRTGDALRHLEALKRIDDEATRLATSTSLALMGARFDFANQELRIARLKAVELQRNIAFEREQLRTERIILIGSVVAIIVVLALLGIWLVTLGRSRNRIRAAHGDLAVTNDRLEKALAVKTEFLATTSHEIRTPLNGILGMTQIMLADTGLPGDQRERVEVMHGAGMTMRALVDDLLDVAKIENGRMTLEQAPFDLAATVRDASRLFEGQAATKGLRFTIDLADCPATVLGDSARIRQIVFNLLSNALKFTATGTVALTASRTADGVAVRVSDSGIGISPDKLEQIFEAFRQADASTTRQFGGTGLGLAICRRLARAMGGDVTVDSVAGQGSTFTLALPLEEVRAEVQAERPVVLIIDRNPIRRAMWTSLCAPHAAVQFVDDSAEAAKRLAEGGIARILADDSAIRDAGGRPDLSAVMAARNAETPVYLLWPETESLEGNEFFDPELIEVIAKPIAGVEVMRKMFGTSSQTVSTPLVTQAA